MSIIKEFLRNPMLTGAIAASSPALVQAMTRTLPLEDASLVVELGPGSGVITDGILSRLAPGARLIAVELNPTFAQRLTERYRDQPVEVIQGSAAELSSLVPDKVDVVVSGLPWTVMPEGLQRRILGEVGTVLTDAGQFATFAYVHAAWAPPARRFAALLDEHFSVRERSGVVWPNLPPAFVHYTTSPRVGSRPECVPPGDARPPTQARNALRRPKRPALAQPPRHG